MYSVPPSCILLLSNLQLSGLFSNIQSCKIFKIVIVVFKMFFKQSILKYYFFHTSLPLYLSYLIVF